VVQALVEPKNQLQVLVDESQLDTTKAKVLLDKFSNYFDIASEWEQKAKSIVVTDESQTADMEMARVGRLFLREKRISVEKTRKELKEQSLREGKAIDGIANVLKAVIVPIEEYLEKQEKFIELKAEAEREAKRQEIERRMEEERLAEEKAKAEEEKRIRAENERLRAEVIEREKAAEIERRKQAEILAKAEAARKAIEDKARKQKEAADKKLRLEREAAAQKHREADEQARKEREAIESKARAEREAAQKKQRELEEAARKERAAAELERKRLEEQLANQIKCPHCGKTFSLKGE